MIGTTLGHEHPRFQALLEKHEAAWRVGHWWDTQAQPSPTLFNTSQHDNRQSTH